MSAGRFPVSVQELLDFWKASGCGWGGLSTSDIVRASVSCTKLQGALTKVKSLHESDCWNVAIAEWLGLDYDHVRHVATRYNLISPDGTARTEKVLTALGYKTETIEDDGRDGIIRLIPMVGCCHVVVRKCGTLLNTTNNTEITVGDQKQRIRIVQGVGQWNLLDL